MLIRIDDKQIVNTRHIVRMEFTPPDPENEDPDTGERSPSPARLMVVTDELVPKFEDAGAGTTYAMAGASASYKLYLRGERAEKLWRFLCQITETLPTSPADWKEA